MSGVREGDGRIGVLFVCLGNICRSPLAKVIFAERVARADAGALVRVDSCGTGGWHAGEGADPRSVKVAAARGLQLEHEARVLHHTDFTSFEYLIAMDRSNRKNMLTMGAPRERVHLMRSFDPLLAGSSESEMDVPDPYYGGEEGFARVYDMLDAACAGLWARIERQLRSKS